MKTLTLTLATLCLATASLAAHADATGGPVTCKDGTTSEHAGRGACSGHGGVNKGATVPAAAAPAAAPVAATPAATAVRPAAAAAPAAAATPAPAATAAKPASGSTKSNSGVSSDPTGAIAKCKDGLYSHASSHSGACSRHGGVAEFLDKQ